MVKSTQQGYSLIELMIATALAALTGLVALQVAASFQASKSQAGSQNEALMSASIGLYQLERELRMAGAGFIGADGLICEAGVNLYYNGAVVQDGTALPFVRIVDGGTGPDSIRWLRTDALQNSAPATILTTMSNADANITVDNAWGLTQGDLFLAFSSDGSKRCTVYQMSAAPTVDVNAFALPHAAGSTLLYNPNAASAFTGPMAYEVSDKVINLGRSPFQAASVVCATGGNSCELTGHNAVAAVPAFGSGTSLASEVVDLQAQYGVAPAGSQSITEWVDATGATWADPTQANLNRIKALRIALVTRGSYEPGEISPTTLVLWDEPAAGQVTVASKRERTLTSAERHYRYHVAYTVVPLINVIRAGL